MNLLGDVIREVLATAKSQKRLVCGLLDAIMFLQKKAEEALICFIPLTQPGDAASHMHIVLLQAFCFENDIPVVEVSYRFFKNIRVKKQKNIDLLFRGNSQLTIDFCPTRFKVFG